MIFGDINLFIGLFLILFSTLLTSTNTSIHLLLTAELLWITLYALTLLIGVIYDTNSLMSLTFFFLIFSAVEFGVGLVILLLQHLLTRTLNLDSAGNTPHKFANRDVRFTNVNALRLKV